MSQNRIVPLIVAVAMFMENMDSTVIATSLPAIAADLKTNPLALKLALTSYLLSLAIFIPASGWTADRFGTRRVFAGAIAVFVLGSVACALAKSLEWFVAARILQGIGGAMMTPVGRLVLVRGVERRDLVNAMAWVTMPALAGPIIGPPVGGFITTYASWPWIFLINVPMGVVGIILVIRFIDDVRVKEAAPFDLRGLVLSGLGLAGLAFGLSVAGLNFLPWQIVTGLIGGGGLFVIAYLRHARRIAMPALDLSLLAIPTYRASVLGGSLFRIGVGAMPFLLPLLLQIGFNMTPFQSGLVTFSAAVGALTMKTAAARILKWVGFRPVLVVNAVLSSAFLVACASFSSHTPYWAMITILMMGGFFRSLQFTSFNTLAYAEIELARMSHATSLASVAQQLSLSAGVAIGALVLESTVRFHQSSSLTASDFSVGFVVVGLIAASSALVFARLPADAGAELADRVNAVEPSETSDQRIG